MKALRESGRTLYAEIISNLPQYQKVVLCIAMILSQVSPLLWRYWANATHHDILACLSVDGHISTVRSLEGVGLLIVLFAWELSWKM